MDKNILDRIKAYLDGTLPEAERESVRAYLTENENDPRVIDLLRSHWARLPENLDQAAGRAAFQQFSNAIGGFRAAGEPRFRNIFRNLRNAAAIIAVPLLALSIFMLTRISQAEPNYLEFSVAHGCRDSLTLPDNTMVWLNSGSRIVYPESFGRKTRKVFISGEAYLDVEKEARRPFVVSSGDVLVRVLGTQFNITSYEDMGSVTVSLIEGSVEIDAERDDITLSTRLVPGDVVRYDKDTGAFERNRFPTDGYCSWRNGGFYFSNQTFTEIAAQFERVFSVKIFIHDPKLRLTRYSLAFVNGESLEEMLEAINFGGRMHITRDRDMIFITSK